MERIRLSHPTGEIKGTILLDGSKSISNRVLIIRSLAPTSFNIHHLSTSDDTSKLSNLLEHGGKDNVYDVGHAGTTFRFLTAYLAIQEGIQVLTGSSRMLERPIGPLVDALRMIGCKISYEGKEGYPPLRIESIERDNLLDSVTIDAGISSQYISALILIAPTLPKGLVINLRGDMVSESYLKLTLQIVKDFGVEATYENQKITIAPQEYKSKDYTIEADWSASSYHYAIVALAKKATLRLEGLFENSFQGDAMMTVIAESTGVQSTWAEEGLNLTKIQSKSKLEYDFVNQPDVAQTVAVICAAKKIESDFSGLKTLRIKETDRIYAVDKELNKISSSFTLIEDHSDSSDEHYQIGLGVSFNDGIPCFDTYKDHRMAMCFAPLALLHPIEINQPNVVSKSYPSFWEDLKTLGFVIEELA